MRKLVTLAAVAPLLVVVPQAPAQDDPALAPATTLSADGRTVTGAGRSVSASQVHDLDPAGQTVTVSGNGFDADKGIYVTFCVVPPANHAPTPCGGGQDRAGSSGSSGWVTSNPPDYAAGLTTPYGPGGSFEIELTVQPAISDTIDCRSVRCAIVTRNDHTRSSDRSQDLLIPVTFRTAGAPAPSGPTTTLPPISTTTTVAPADPSLLPPVATLSPTGDAVGDGTRMLRASEVDDLAHGAAVTVAGSGFDPAQGIYVALCRVPEPGQAPAPCSTGRAAAAWISSNPPDYGRELAQPYADGGTFEVELEVAPEIDAATDCRVVACAIATRSDDTAGADRRNDLFLPVTFTDEPASATTGEDTAVAAADDGDDGGSALPAAAIGGAGAALVAVAGALAVRSRRRRATVPS